MNSLSIAKPEVALPRVGGAASVRDFVELTKPRLTSLVSLTALVGYMSGAGARGASDLPQLVAALGGTTLLAAGGCALNMVMEHELDARMERTRTRPIPSGRLQPFESAIFGMALTALGMFLLIAGTNALTSLLGVAAVVSYLFVYTPLKKTTGLCTIAGAFPGALPPAMGWTAAANQIEPGTWVLFSILFLWQLPHFLAIAWMRREDYERGGFPMLTVVDPEGGSAGRQAVLHCLALLPVSLLPSVLGFAGVWYFFTALVLSLAYTAAAGRLAWVRTTQAARGMFLASLVYLPVLLTVLMLDGVAR